MLKETLSIILIILLFDEKALSLESDPNFSTLNVLGTFLNAVAIRSGFLSSTSTADDGLKMFEKSYSSPGECSRCMNYVELAQNFFSQNSIDKGMVKSVCETAADFSSSVCERIAERYYEPIHWIFMNTELSPLEICSHITSSSCFSHKNISIEESQLFWELNLPPLKEDIEMNVMNSDVRKNILHLTDVHLDLSYEAGSIASCKDPLCCHAESIDSLEENQIAGFWSAINGSCDIPMNFMMNSLEYIAKNHKIDGIFWTGDILPHNIDSTTKEETLNVIKKFKEAIDTVFKDIPVVPVLGNHDSDAASMFIPGELSSKANQSMAWLYQELAENYWSSWIDEEEAKETFSKGGYYAINLNDGWKVIVLNTNIAAKCNLWTVAHHYDPDGQLEWLIQELDKSETYGEFVTILGHFPPGYQLYDVWFYNYVRIIDRYQHIINNGFFGHTHMDEVRLIYNQNQEPININYVSGSLSSYSYVNPMYAIFQTDENGKVQSSSIYMTDANENEENYQKNENSEPIWYKEYSLPEDYLMKNMSVESWHEFLTNAENENDLATRYSEHYHRFSDQFIKHSPNNGDDGESLIKNSKPCSLIFPTCEVF